MTLDEAKPMTNEEVIREIASKYPPEEIVASALVAMAMILTPLIDDSDMIFSVSLSSLKLALERNPHTLFQAANTKQ